MDSPSRFDAAMAAFERGEAEPALALLDSLPDGPAERLQALVLVVNAGIRFERIDAAIAGLRQLSELQPEQSRWRRLLADALNRRGAERRERGDPLAAFKDFDAALRLALMHPQASFNAALAQRDLGDLTAALRHAEEHLHGLPEDAEARLLRAELLAETGQQALADSQLDALLRDPACPRGLRLAMGLARIGRLEAAIDVLEMQGTEAADPAAMDVAERIRKQGDPGTTRRAFEAIDAACRRAGRCTPLRAALAAALHVDPIPLDANEIEAGRQGFATGLQQLEQDWPKQAIEQLGSDLEQACWSNFYLAYQGRDDRQLQSGYGDFLARVAVTLAPDLSMPMPARTGGSARVGFVSSSFRDCTVGHYFGQWPTWLQDAGFQVHLFQLGPQHDATTESIGAGLHRVTLHDGSLNALAEAVRDSDLDLLIYPELGMDMRLLPLAALRLARCQAAAWGHPVTTGLPSIDAFISCAEMEPEDGESHYRERLHLLPGLGVDYPLAEVPEGDCGIELPVGVRVLVPQSAFKLHPDNDRLLAEIAAECPEAMFLLFEPDRTRWQERLSLRLGRAFEQAGADPRHQLHWLPQVPRSRYLQINHQCDLMLDSLHWSGGNTSLDALTAGLPLLSCRGRFMRGRQSAAMLQRLGLTEQLLANEPEQMRSMALSLIRDGERRRWIGRRIREGLPNLLDPQAARQHFVDLAGRLCRGV